LKKEATPFGSVTVIARAQVVAPAGQSTVIVAVLIPAWDIAPLVHMTLLVAKANGTSIMSIRERTARITVVLFTKGPTPGLLYRTDEARPNRHGAEIHHVIGFQA
jgi:hypothetical protein